MAYNNIYKDLAYKTIKELVDDGVKVIKPDPSDKYPEISAQKWLEYSERFVELSTKNLDRSIYLNYLRLLVSVQRENISVYQKVIKCLDYLIEVLQIIVKQY